VRIDVLLDTHVFLWATSRPEALSDRAREVIEDLENDVYVSAAVAWEIVIKHARGKLELPLSPPLFIASRLRANGFRELPITQDHALAIASLPAIHADPFDRIMIAQAQCASLTFVTRDARALQYPVLKIEA
jgi:PIN domain nuclease of toxin-antitoxin system